MKTMKNLCFALLAACVLFLPAAAQASEKTNVSILSVDGSGAGQTVPDQARISIGVTSHSTDAKQAQQENADRASAIQNALTSFGIPEKCIQTRNYSFHPTYNNDRNHDNEINGYTVDNTVIVIVNDLSLTGQVIDLALQNGANKINSLSFSAQNTEKVRKEALLNAVRDARNKADIIAGGLGKQIVGIQNVSESTSSLQERNFDTMMLAKSANVTPISPGSLELSANVHIDFILGN